MSKSTASPGSRAPEDFLYLESRWQCTHLQVPDSGLSRFFEGLAEGELLAGSCAGCGEIGVPLARYCERCLLQIEQEVVVGPGGSVRAASVIQVAMAGLQEPPGTIACVQPDGAATALLTRLLTAGGGTHTATPQDLIGQRCRLRVAPDFSGRWEDFWFEISDEVSA